MKKIKRLNRLQEKLNNTHTEIAHFDNYIDLQADDKESQLNLKDLEMRESWIESRMNGLIEKIEEEKNRKPELQLGSGKLKWVIK